jgi:hypothetical protein
MDTLLIAVALVSLAIAAAMSLVVLKLVREDRRRSEARIAALLEAARVPEAPSRPAPRGRAGLSAPRSAPQQPAPRGADLPLRVTPAAAELFVEPERRPSWGPRIALAAAAVAVLVGVSFTMLGPGAGPATTSTGGAAAESAPLELLTLRHVAGAGSLTVSGLVQNPRGGAALRRVTAMVHALDADGAIVATHRAPIDLATFGPGEESPFLVTVPVRGAVARYRVGFRSEGGDVLAHVDRRTGADALAHR